jgi:hypothetical protein
MQQAKSLDDKKIADMMVKLAKAEVLNKVLLLYSRVFVVYMYTLLCRTLITDIRARDT